MANRRVSSGGHPRRSRDCEGWIAQSVAEVAQQAYGRRRDKRLAGMMPSESPSWGDIR